MLWPACASLNTLGNVHPQMALLLDGCVARMRGADFLQCLSVNVHWVLQMQGKGDEGVLPVLQVPGNAADVVLGEHLQKI